MYTYILKRLLLTIPMMIGITFISFTVMQLAPGAVGGGGGGGEMSARMTRDQRRIMEETFHLNKPVWKRYFYWIGMLQEEPSNETKMQWEQDDAERAARGEPALSHKRGLLFGDFGYSMETHSVTVWDRLKDAIPITLLFNIVSFLVIYLIAIPIGVYSATHPYTGLDRFTTVLMFLLFSLPSFWVAVMMIKLMVTLPPDWQLPFYGLEPVGSERLSTLTWFWECGKHMILPVIAMSYASLAGLSRYMRTGMIDVIRADYIRTARAKGLNEFYVIYKHALRNSLIPVITILGGELPALIGGSVILETIFGIQGMGYMGYKALLARDYTVLMADLTLVAVLVMVGFLISDLLYVMVDPRIKFE